MRKVKVLAIVMAVFLVASIAWALTWHTTNQFTVAWDPVTVQDGTVSYKVLVANALTDPDKANPVEAEGSPTANTQITLTLATQGQYYVGVKSVLTLTDGTKIESDDTNWSDDPAGNQGEVAFGIQYYIINAPGGLRPGGG